MLESGQFSRRGGHEAVPLELRILAATSHDLGDAVAAGTFRKALAQHLRGALLFVPPLRARPAAIPIIVEEILTAAASRAVGGPQGRISPAALALLGKHRWPGNVRELRSVIDRALLLTPTGVIEPAHLNLR